MLHTLTTIKVQHCAYIVTSFSSSSPFTSLSSSSTAQSGLSGSLWAKVDKILGLAKQTLTELSVCGLSGCGAHWVGVAWVEDKDIGLEPAPTPMPYWNGCPPQKKNKGLREADWTAAGKRLLLGAEETIFSSSPIAGDIYPMVIRHRQPLLPLTQQLLTFF